MIKAVIIDHEQASMQNLVQMLETHFASVRVTGTACNAAEALALVYKEKPDVVFFDIAMAGPEGPDLALQIKNLAARLVFTTTHQEYAIQAIRLGAFDYLVKPLRFDELDKCMQRLSETLRASNHPATIHVHVREGVLFIHTKDIVRLKANGSYTDIYLDQQRKITTSKVLKEYETLLPPSHFYRCHNSYIVNLRKIEKLASEDGYFVEFRDGSRAEVSRRNKDELLERMRSLSSR